MSTWTGAPPTMQSCCLTKYLENMQLTWGQGLKTKSSGTINQVGVRRGIMRANTIQFCSTPNRASIASIAKEWENGGDRINATICVKKWDRMARLPGAYVQRGASIPTMKTH